MTICQSFGASIREVREIDALVRALGNLRHWSGTTAARSAYADDQGRRLYAAAADLREQARADSLHAAYRLFEIDAIHDAWVEAGGEAA